MVQTTGRNTNLFDFAFAVLNLASGVVGLKGGNLIVAATKAANACGPAGGFEVGQTLIFSPECFLDIY